ncbi:MAG: hypothetical protein ABIQ18_11195 [Umezawaea sp.]
MTGWSRSGSRNNTNPVLDLDSPEHAELVEADVDGPPDGTVVEI